MTGGRTFQDLSPEGIPDQSVGSPKCGYALKMAQYQAYDNDFGSEQEPSGAGWLNFSKKTTRKKKKWLWFGWGF